MTLVSASARRSYTAVRAARMENVGRRCASGPLREAPRVRL
jgi:hypothetical protein